MGGLDRQNKGCQPRRIGRWNPVFFVGYIYGWLSVTFCLGRQEGAIDRLRAHGATAMQWSPPPGFSDAQFGRPPPNTDPAMWN
jgi:hypothetical protein